MKNIIHKLPPELLHLLQETGRAAASKGERTYLAGGTVRDLLLGRPGADLDLVVEGKAIRLARQVAKMHGWEIKTHPRFGTATLHQANFKLDLVTARSEIYTHPGALPEVKEGAILTDLARRDFTINAMAISLNPEDFGVLLDPHDGRADLNSKLIRILHPGSFADDPTRILRALRYEQRLSFRLEEETEKLLRRSANNLTTVTAERWWHELELILEEESPEKIIRRAQQTGILAGLCPELRTNPDLDAAFSQVRQTPDQSLSRRAIYLTILSYPLDPDEAERFIARFKMPGWASRTVRKTAQLKTRIGGISAPEMRPGEIHRKLTRYPQEVLEGIALSTSSSVIRDRIELHLQKWLRIRPSLTGDDLINMGIMPGQRLGQILRALKEARIDHEVTSREEEEALVKRMI